MNTFKGNVIKEEIESLGGMRKRRNTEYYVFMDREGNIQGNEVKQIEL